MKTISLFLLAVFGLTGYATAQRMPDTLWTGMYSTNNSSAGAWVEQTSDLGFIMTGSNYGYLLLVKTDQSGNTQWMRTCGGSGMDAGLQVKQLNDGGYIAIGYYTPSGQSDCDIYLVRTDDVGDTLWTRFYPGTDFGYSVAVTSDGGFILTGNCHEEGPLGSSHAVLLKTDADGNLTWYQTYRDWKGYGMSIIQIANGNYIVTGGYAEDGQQFYRVYLMETDPVGEIIWLETYGGFNGACGKCVQQTPDGGYIVAGTTKAYGAGEYDFYLIKTDCEGDTQWTKTYGGIYDDYGECVDQTDDGGYIITGETDSFFPGSSSNLYIVRTDAMGDTMWTGIFGDIAVYDPDKGMCVQQTSDGGYIVAGSTESYAPAYSSLAWLIRLDTEGIEIVDDLTIELSGEDVILNWSDVPYSAEYKIYRTSTPHEYHYYLTPISIQTDTTYVDSNAVGDKYFYKVVIDY